MAIEAFRLAVRSMSPVVFLSDGYLANSSEPWRIPNPDDLPHIEVTHRTDPTDFFPYVRDEVTLGRPWALPGTPGLEHRIGGIEKASDSGNISYDPANHQKMTNQRRDKVLRVAGDVPPQAFEAGGTGDDIVVVGWGSTYGPISRAVDNLRDEGHAVAHLHLRHIWPLARNLGEQLASFDRILVPEMNDGQLVTLLRSEFLVPAEGLNKVTGKPFKISEIEAAVRARLDPGGEVT
jgi:2-oxoglutarate ferredoxin oxidoreductase subunit alpha